MSKYEPKSAAELMEYAKIQLGQGAHRVNVTDDQMMTRMREAFDKFNTFHYNATEQIFVSQQISADDQFRGFFITPDYVKTVIRILAFDGQFRGQTEELWVPGGMFPTDGWTGFDGGAAGGNGNVDVGVGPYGITNAVTYYLMDVQQANYDEILHHETPMRYNDLTHRLYPDISKDKLVPGNYIVYECFALLEKLGEPAIFNDSWLKKYYTALVGVQWGVNLTKHINAPLYGGDAQVNGDGILKRYEDMQKDLEDQLENVYTAQPLLWIG